MFKTVAVIFLIIEGIALIIGARLTGSITSTVDKLYDATERVKKGDFSYRIRVPSSDQISALGEAFDSMTASVERLLRESEEKLRLESELQIARRSRRSCFPGLYRKFQDWRSMGLQGGALGQRRLLRLLQAGGKQGLSSPWGCQRERISAALLMAAIQSALRAHFYDGFVPASGSHTSSSLDRLLVSRLKIQLYESHSPGKIRDLLSWCI